MSSSSSSISATTVNGTTRITGLSSGIDVDTIVSELMTAEKAKKLNPLQQKEQLAEWRQEAYRSVVSDISDFTSKYFSVGTSSSTSLLNSKNFKQYTVTSSSSAVTASYTSSASAGTHTVAVSSLATKAIRSSSASLSKDVQGATAADYSSLTNSSFVISVDGADHTVSLANVTDVTSLQTAIDDAVGSGMLTVNADNSGILTITAADSGVGEIGLSDPDSGTSGLDALGFSLTDGAILSNRLDTSDTLAEIAGQLNTGTALSFNGSDQVALTINGTSFTFNKTDTLASVISKVNSSSCGATLAYNTSSGKLVLTASSLGAGDTLTVAEPTGSDGTGSNFLAAFLDSSQAGTNAKVTVDGAAYTRSANTITVDGVTYTLNATTTDSTKATVSLTQDVDGIYDLISNFVSDYNKLIDTINGKLDESYDNDYPPLTDDQKKEMTDDEITNWETKAKTGLLEHDTTLTSFLREIRSAFVNSIAGVSTSIFDIGIDTGSYEEKGKLYIDEDTLKDTIQNDPDSIEKLFTQQSSTASYAGTSSKVRQLSSAELSKRYSGEGIALRFYDILGKYVSTIRDSAGNKGFLVDKAGIESDSSKNDNYYSDQITKYQEAISKEKDRLDNYEDRLYSKYTALETYINKMNTQLSALSSYISSSSSS